MCIYPWDITHQFCFDVCFQCKELYSYQIRMSSINDILFNATLTFFIVFMNGDFSKMALVVKNLPANEGDARDTGSVPESGRSSGEGNGNPLHYYHL